MKVIATVTGPLKKYVGEFSKNFSVSKYSLQWPSREGGSCVSNNWCPTLSCWTPGDPVRLFQIQIDIDLIKVQPFIHPPALVCILIIAIRPDCQDLRERVHRVQRDQPQFWDAGHRESRAGCCLPQSLGSCQKRPPKSAYQLNLQAGRWLSEKLLIVQHCSFLVTTGHLMQIFSSLMVFTIQQTGNWSHLLSPSSLDSFGPNMLESAFTYMW